jgi:hypothetical protein
MTLPDPWYPPTVDDVRAWIQVPATTLDDAALGQVIDAESVIQGDLLTFDPFGSPRPDIVQALYRRVARHVAARGVPLGILGTDAEYGGVYLGRWDAEIARLEGPTRTLVFG